MRLSRIGKGAQSWHGKYGITGMLSSMKDIVNNLSKLQRRPVTTLRNADNLILLPQFESLPEPKLLGNRQGLDGIKSMWMELFSRI